jgi:hypothetical protein
MTRGESRPTSPQEQCPGAEPILALHEEIVIQCDEDDAEKVEKWLKIGEYWHSWHHLYRKC